MDKYLQYLITREAEMRSRIIDQLAKEEKEMSGDEWTPEQKVYLKGQTTPMFCKNNCVCLPIKKEEKVLIENNLMEKTIEVCKKLNKE